MGFLYFIVFFAFIHQRKKYFFSSSLKKKKMPAIFSTASGRSLCVLAIIAMVLSVAFSFASAARPRGHALTKDYSYEQYVRDFSLHGRTEKEHTFRREIFNKRRDEAIAHNKLGKSWTKGINQYSDWTDDEIKSRLFNNNYKNAVRNRVNV